MLRLELIDITKRYPSVVANDHVSLRVAPGQIHAVLGENGAGKSTLMKIVYGVVQPDQGEIRWNGRAVRIRSPHEARALGIAMVFQHFSLFDTLTVAENVWLGLAGLTLAEVTARIDRVASEYGLELSPEKPVHALSVGERQRVEIVRALLVDPKLLILDEPTSVLNPQAVTKLFVTLRKLAAEGCSILYISHKLEEIRALCHHCTVLRAGRVTGDVDPTRETNASLSRLMIGVEPPKLEHHAPKLGDVALSLNRLTLAPKDRFGTALTDIDLTLRGGQILGVAGISGNGQAELFAVLSGEDFRASGLRMFGRDISGASPRERRALGLYFVPEERLGRAAVPTLSLAENTLLTRSQGVARSGFLRPRQIEQLARQLIERFHVKAAGPRAPAKSLSGGNLQKFIVGRDVDATPKVLVVAQPTWGVDVGAAAQIRGELLTLRDEGCAVLVVSEDLDELFEISDQIAVLAKGRLSAPLPTKDVTIGQLGEWMSGLFPPTSGTGGEGAHA
jgi:simple sugar transport system ATP-binding protein